MDPGRPEPPDDDVLGLTHGRVRLAAPTPRRAAYTGAKSAFVLRVLGEDAGPTR
jgi:hypothetical protein